jgi:hypothetical protein
MFIKEYRYNKKIKKGKISKDDNRKEPVEVRLLKSYYKVDIDELNYSSVLNTIAFISSLDMAIIITIACLVKIGLIQILIALILVIPIIYSSYYLLAKYYKYKINKKSIKHKNKIKKGTK